MHEKDLDSERINLRRYVIAKRNEAVVLQELLDVETLALREAMQAQAELKPQIVVKFR